MATTYRPITQDNGRGFVVHVQDATLDLPLRHRGRHGRRRDFSTRGRASREAAAWNRTGLFRADARAAG